MRRPARLLAGLLIMGFFLWAAERAAHYEQARAAGVLSERAASSVGAMVARSESTYQGLTARQWAQRAVRNRREANQQRRNSEARGRTIRRLQREIRMRHPSATGHWLDGAFLCLYRYERGAAGWQTDTGNGFRGGLQFDASFSYTYGPAWAKAYWGSNPAHWPAAVQMSAAMHAWTTRGFSPWPTTRRLCGL